MPVTLNEVNDYVSREATTAQWQDRAHATENDAQSLP